jgi:LmbE family N-acetylglucosaminyl deacetylase
VLKFSVGQPAGRPLRILCIGAHCDDIEIGAGAAVLHLLETHPGSSVCWVVCASDPLRRAEAEASAHAFCGAAGELITRIGDLPENVLPQHTIEVRELLVASARAFAPDLVFSPRRDDLHQDHRLLGEMALQLFRDQPILEYELVKYDGDLVTPNIYLAVDEALAQRKVDLILQLFPSQHSRTWFDREAFLGLMRVRGVECNERYAEGFHARKVVLGDPAAG